jgi:hypothetical protein
MMLVGISHHVAASVLRRSRAFVDFMSGREGMSGIDLVTGKNQASYLAEVFIIDVFG